MRLFLFSVFLPLSLSHFAVPSVVLPCDRIVSLCHLFHFPRIPLFPIDPLLHEIHVQHCGGTRCCAITRWFQQNYWTLIKPSGIIFYIRLLLLNKLKYIFKNHIIHFLFILIISSVVLVHSA